MTFTHLRTKSIVFGFILATCTPALHGSQNPACPPNAVLPEPKKGPTIKLSANDVKLVPELFRELKQLISDAIRQPTQSNQAKLLTFTQQPIMNSLCRQVIEERKRNQTPFAFMKVMDIDQWESSVDPLFKKRWIAAQQKFCIPDTQQLPISLFTPKSSIPPDLVTPITATNLSKLFIDPRSRLLQQPGALEFALYHEAAHLRNRHAALNTIYSIDWDIIGQEATVKEKRACEEEQQEFKKFAEASADEAAYRAFECHRCIRHVIDARQELFLSHCHQQKGYLSKETAERIADELQTVNKLCPAHSVLLAERIADELQIANKHEEQPQKKLISLQKNPSQSCGCLP